MRLSLSGVKMDAKINLRVLLVMFVILFGVGRGTAPGRTFFVAMDCPKEACCRAYSYVVIDDFESYDTNTNLIYDTWREAKWNWSGSYIDLAGPPFDPAHDSEQSMFYMYDNSIKWDYDHYWSEVELPFVGTHDFTENGAEILRMYFYGDAGNPVADTERLYVGLGGSYAEVKYGDNGEDMNDLKLAEWTEWNIALSDFAGVDLSAVTALFIGFGDRDNTSEVGGFGFVFLDDIRLYPPKCVPEFGPVADLYADGHVNLNDFAILAYYWLEPNCATSHNCDGADLAYDNKVDLLDLKRFTENWLRKRAEMLNIDLAIDHQWMYQNLPGATRSRLGADVLVNYDPLSNSSYTYEWEFVLPSDVSVGPATVDGGGPSDAFWAFASPSCDEPNGLSDLGQTFAVRVTVTGSDYGNGDTAEAEFGIALLGDVNNDGVVNLKDRQMANDFWQAGLATGLGLKDCDVNCDDVVNLKDRSIINDVWQGEIGRNSVSNPCPFR